ncbi:cyclin-like protein [Morchella snyderi]|nr:cyclin-like protein [Morchella snyderi]
MQSRRAPRVRSASNIEANDENKATTTTRLTRAKAAALSTDAASTKLTTSKLATTTTTAAQNNRKRAALGDVSNVVKADGGAVEESKKVGGKKVSGKIALTTKAAATNGVTKTTRTAKAAPIKNTGKEEEVKRTNNGSGVMAKSRKRVTTAAAAAAKAKKEVVVEEKDASSVTTTTTTTTAAATTVKAVAAVELKVKIDTKEAEPVVHASKKIRTKEPVPRPPHNDLDDEDADDPLMVSEYVSEIFDYLREIEPATQPNPDYMDHQDELKWKMRGILIDWLIEVHTRFRLLPETLFLAVNIVDRFLSSKVVKLDKLQLVGVTAMFIAAKYEEVFSPHVQYFRHVADDGFTEEEILRAERFVLSTLDYNLSYPNPMNFLRRISKADQYDFQTRTVAKYLMEISLLDHRFMEFLPSQVAAAAMYLSRMMLERGPWDADLIHYSDYTEDQIMPVFHLMIDYLARPVKHEAFFKKYASKKFMKASIHARQWAKKNAKAHGIDVSAPEPVESEEESR